jgi:hypothetical protein
VTKKRGRTLAEILRERPAFVNVGVTEFADALEAQGAEVERVEWKPPAGGDPELAALLDRLL